MKLFLIVLFLGAVFAGPQAKDLLKGFTGDEKPKKISADYEEVPYTVIQDFEVRFFLFFTFLLFKFQGYEERLYPSVKWACTEMTYERTAEEPISMWNILSKLQNMMSKPSSKMFMKLFRYVLIFLHINNDQLDISMVKMNKLMRSK